MRPVNRLSPAAALLLISMSAAAVTEQEAAQLGRAGRHAEAAEAWRALLARQPESARLRLELADALAKDRQWDAAAVEYEAVLRRQPNNGEALRGLGTVRRWQGRTGDARRAYEKARAVEPGSADAALGLAATYELDHDYQVAQRLYSEAAKQWPKDEDVQQAAANFRHRASPRAYLFYEDDLSFETKQAGVAIPFGAREELGVELQREMSFFYRTGDTSYTRDDAKLLYTHFFALNHSIDASARHSSYDYPRQPTDFSAIDSYDEYRVRYTHPFVPEQVGALRYTARPTELLAGDDFVAHKLEAELRSAWSPRLRTLAGTGWLRDLDDNATRASDLRTTTLLKLGIEGDPINELTLSARYITNPDLDNTIDDTTILQASYDFAGGVSGLFRYKLDDYKTGDDQNSYYVGARYVPTVRFWSELGIKRVERGPESGTYPLVSVVYTF
jgi:tetratricopeptide (TPR) repeat protein